MSFDRKPDLDNANVGTYNEYHTFLILFWYSRKLFGMCLLARSDFYLYYLEESLCQQNRKIKGLLHSANVQSW